MVALFAPPLEGLFDLACREGVDIRPTLLRVLTDLYVQTPTHTDAEEAQYVELATRLIETVDAGTRATVAGRLASYRSAPAPVLDRLAAQINVSSPPTAPALSDTVENEPRARRSENELTESFFSANAQERRFILTNLDAFVPIAGPRTLGANPDIIREIENAALARSHTGLVTALERAVGIRRDLAERVVNDVSGEPIVVVARALGMSSDVLQRVLLFINPHVGQSVARVFSLASLFEEITPAAAEDMISLWRNAGRQRRTSYEPLLWDNERTKPRAAAVHASSPAERLSQEALPARLHENGR